jgi:epoxyqueuosine reductase
MDFNQLGKNIKSWANELGFQQAGITDTNLKEAENHLLDWLDQGHHGKMDYMQRHGTHRSRPAELLPGTRTVISARMDYWPHESPDRTLSTPPETAVLSCYALGRDYHKTFRKRLQKLADRISNAIGEHHYRVYTDSAPVLEKALAEKAGLGWIGKHTNLIDEKIGSWFFLGEIYTDLPLPVDSAAKNHCGTCQSCIDICPTQAIIAPYELDARRCISYLTIELRESIPVELRPLIGNRIYGCDDCQLVCPWNKFAKMSSESDFMPREYLDETTLLTLWGWTEDEFLKLTEGSAIRRIGYDCWLRNIAVALGNAPTNRKITEALSARLDSTSPMVKEHIRWALARQHNNANS